MLSVCFQLDTYIAEVLAGVTLNVNTFEFWHGRGPSGIVRRVGSITFKMYFNYKIQITFFKVIQILFSITLAMTGKIQNTFLESN